MSYDPTTDFMALARLTSGGVRTERMPGLDYLVAALARSHLIVLSVGQTAPTSNQAGTVWFKPALPDWTAEGLVFLWDANAAAYTQATPALWAQLLTVVSNIQTFQAVINATATINALVNLAAVTRAAPVLTTLTLPSVFNQGGKVLRVADWSTGVANHQIILTPFGTETIMRQATFNLFSTADQAAGVALYPSTDLNGWVIAP